MIQVNHPAESCFLVRSSLWRDERLGRRRIFSADKRLLWQTTGRGADGPNKSFISDSVRHRDSTVSLICRFSNKYSAMKALAGDERLFVYMFVLGGGAMIYDICSSESAKKPSKSQIKRRNQQTTSSEKKLLWWSRSQGLRLFTDRENSSDGISRSVATAPARLLLSSPQPCSPLPLHSRVLFFFCFFFCWKPDLIYSLSCIVSGGVARRVL